MAVMGHVVFVVALLIARMLHNWGSYVYVLASAAPVMVVLAICVVVGMIRSTLAARETPRHNLTHITRFNKLAWNLAQISLLLTCLGISCLGLSNEWPDIATKVLTPFLVLIAMEIAATI
jgi:hypothetical protein